MKQLVTRIASKQTKSTRNRNRLKNMRRRLPSNSSFYCQQLGTSLVRPSNQIHHRNQADNIYFPCTESNLPLHLTDLSIWRHSSAATRVPHIWAVGASAGPKTTINTIENKTKQKLLCSFEKTHNSTGKRYFKTLKKNTKKQQKYKLKSPRRSRQENGDVSAPENISPP